MMSDPLSSISVKGHEMATKFKAFLDRHIKGRVLDVGSGPQPVPLYLEGYPVDEIVGIDPLWGEHPFEFMQHTIEDAVIPDESFDTIIAATSLDHVYDPDRAIEKIHRLLKPDGVFVIWQTFFPGAPRYSPSMLDWKPADEYHVFHYSEEWFRALLAPYFFTMDMDMMWRPYSATFYAKAKRRTILSARLRD